MICKKCGTEIDDKAVVCVNCGCAVKPQKPIYKKWWFWVLAIIIVAGVASSAGGENGEVVTSVPNSNTVSKVEIVYEVIDLQNMLDDLSNNAMKAENTYQDKYVEITGEIKNFDSDGNYINIEPVKADKWNFETVMCYIKGEEQGQILMEESIGDTVTIKGKITSVGEVMGYSIDVDTIN